MKKINNSMQYQKGMTAIGWLFVISIISFFALIAIKIIPVYLGDMEVNDAIVAAANEPESYYYSKRELRKSFSTRMMVSSFSEDINPKLLKIEKFKNGSRKAVLNYESRTNFAANIFIVISFNHSVDIPRGNTRN